MSLPLFGAVRPRQVSAVSVAALLLATAFAPSAYSTDQQPPSPGAYAAQRPAKAKLKTRPRGAVSKTRKAAPPIGTSGASAITEKTFDLLDDPMETLRTQSNDLRLNPSDAKIYRSDYLEGLANEAALSRIVQAVYRTAEKKKWRQRERFHIFSMEALAAATPSANGEKAFNAEGLRVAVLAFQVGNRQRGILLTSNFLAAGDIELAELFTSGKLVNMLDTDQANDDEINAYAQTIIRKVTSGDRRESEYLPVAATARAWMAGCEAKIAGRFCVDAKVYDSNDTNSSAFFEALLGNYEAGRDHAGVVAEIRHQNLYWPIDRTSLPRGYKLCRCKDKHFGLDLAAVMKTPVKAMADGTVRQVGNLPGWGRAVVIEHTLPSGRQYITLYAHLSKFKPGLKVGSLVRRAELIAYSGNSGHSKGPHLHVEVRALEDGKEPLDRPNGRTDLPFDPLRALNVFNVIVEPFD